ncbi:ATP-binding cassette domain-containing protein [Betaproteobacteria bacterium]|nr:ATP-binding cassette domain-containing protein [Betaproteobacteria bacterium]
MSIDVSSICLDYDGSVVLKDVSFTVEPGEILALVGPNGAGKSSLLNIMSGNKKPNAGTVKYDGTLLNKISISERATLRSVMGQYAPIVYDYSVSDVIEMGWIQSNLFKSSETKFYDEMIGVTTECKLETLLRRKFNTLSGGEQRRVHFARSLLQLRNEYNTNSQKYLFLDEPTANMDIYWELQIMNSARKLANKGTGVFLIIHDLNLAMKFADKIALLAKGKIEKITRPEDFFDKDLFKLVYGLQMSFDEKLMKIFYF